MEDIILGVFAVALLLGIASLLVPLAERLRMPHAVLLAALGMGVGLLTVGVAPGTGEAGMLGGLGEFHLEAEALLYLFLPALLFTVGVNIDVRGLFDEFAAVSMLAVVAVVVCTGVVGLALSQATDLPVVACYLLGAIVATTDPAAVIAVFRDLGAPRRLTILVQGESLFNDAAAIAMFVIFLDVLLGVKSAGVGSGILDFLGNFAGGVALGYGLGRAVCWVLGRLGDAVVAQITATIVLAYLSFVIGEHYLGVSGIVAVAVSSLVVAAHGRVIMGSGGWKTLIEVWHHLEFWCNSLIFVLAALLAGRLLSSVTWNDMALLAVLIPSALAARAAVLFGLLPGLRALGLMQPVDGRYKAVVLWGGLRGAVTLTLALAVANDGAIPGEVRHFVGVLATGFVLFTLFVGAPTLRPLLRLLGLNRLDRIERALRDRVMALSQASLGDEIRAFAADSGLDPALYDKISSAASATDGEAFASAAGGGEDEDEDPLSRDERVQVGLLALAAREKGHYLDRSVGRAASPRLLARLSSAADGLLDRAKTGGAEGYAREARAMIEFNRAIHAAHWLFRRFGWSPPLGREIADRFETLLLVQLVLRELGAANRGPLRALLGAAAGDRIQEIIETRRAEVVAALAAIELQYPRYAAELRVQYVARGALRLEEADYRDKFEQAFISPEVYRDLMRGIEARQAAHDRRPPLHLGMKLAEMMRRVPMFASLSVERMGEIARLLRPRLAMPGERIIERDAPGDAMFFIAGGAVDVRLPQGDVRLGEGGFFGEMALLDGRPRRADVYALGFTQLLVLAARDMQRLMRAHPEIEEAIRRTAEARRLPDATAEKTATG